MDIEGEYVRAVYKRLSSLPLSSDKQNTSQKVIIRWNNVQKFVNQLSPGSTVIDVGCGKAKYHRKDCFFMDCDICLEVISQLRLPPMVDLQLADVLNLPYRSNSIDAALLVSVLHHFTTLDRRKRALAEVARCLRPSGQVLIYVWAFEQPNGRFPAQDVLVPYKWHSSDNISSRANTAKIVHMSLFERICKLFAPLRILSRRVLLTLSTVCTSKHLSATSIPRSRQYRIRYDVVDRFSMEFAEYTIELALLEALSVIQQFTAYRFYHLFKKDELKALIAVMPSLRLVRLDYDHANWWAVAKKVDSIT